MAAAAAQPATTIQTARHQGSRASSVVWAKVRTKAG